MSFKEKIMNKMMDNQFQNMSSDDKKKMMETMMDKFFSNMSDDEKKEMMSGFKETANTAKFATSELRGLFDEWCQQIEKEVLDFIKEKKSIKLDELAAKFNLSEESIKYILGRLAGKNLIDYKV